jgi:hypothetical protein
VLKPTEQIGLFWTGFAGAKELIKKAVGSDWAELTHCIPAL